MQLGPSTDGSQSSTAAPTLPLPSHPAVTTTPTSSTLPAAQRPHSQAVPTAITAPALSTAAIPTVSISLPPLHTPSARPLHTTLPDRLAPAWPASEATSYARRPHCPPTTTNIRYTFPTALKAAKVMDGHISSSTVLDSPAPSILPMPTSTSAGKRERDVDVHAHGLASRCKSFSRMYSTEKSMRLDGDTLASCRHTLPDILCMTFSDGDAT